MTMERLVLKSVWNGLAIVGLVLGVWFLISHDGSNDDSDTNGPTIIGKGPVLDAVKQVNKQILAQPGSRGYRLRTK